MFFRQLELGPMQNFYYLLGCEETKECAVIDCGYGHEKILQEAKRNGYNITKILLTHFHYDHSGEAEILAEKTGAPIYGHKRALLKRETTINSCIIPSCFIPLTEGDTVNIGHINGIVLHARGHQSDHVLYLFTDRIFTGDTLFVNKIGRVDFEDSEPLEMKKSLELIKNLPDKLLVFSGHNYGHVPYRTLGEEKRENPYLTGELKRW